MIDPVERQLFIEGVFLKYGYDFRHYSKASFDRRLGNILDREKCENLLQLLQLLLQDRTAFRRILSQMTIGTTEFFRDPLFFKALREKIFPVLATYPSLQMWVAGCSTGEELYSLAILLKESGLFEKTTIFATDINPASLQKARDGIFDNRAVQSFTRQYLQSGGKNPPSDYYTSNYGSAIFDSSLCDNVVFSEHNLATDAPFAEFHLIICRNVLIYFDQNLQNRVFHLFQESLIERGFLGIGSKENLRFSQSYQHFSVLDEKQHCYQKKPTFELGGESLFENSKRRPS
ncbi:MAG: protein-glutamate O-methyltransferase CheR [Pseudobdellovibrionaceae bacterium]